MIQGEKRQHIFRRHPRISLIIMVGFCIVLMDLLLGALLIPMDLHAFRTAHPYYHHDLLPNQSQQTAWGPISYLMSTNDLGFRDEEIRPVSQASDKYRILLLGDSHTEGVGVSFAESFAGRVASKFNSDSVDILNAAVVSYSPKLHFLKTKYLIEQMRLKFDALYVFIDISDIQNAYAYKDFEPKIATRWVHPRIISKYLKDHSFLFYHGNKILEDRARDSFYHAIAKQDATENNTVDLYRSFFDAFNDDVLLSNPDFHTTLTDWYSDEMLYQRWGRAGVDLMTRHMNQLVSLCREHEVDLTISVHPWRGNIRKGNPEDEHVTYWRTFAREKNIGFINFFPLFMGSIHPDSAIQQYYLPEDNHWNSAGHQLVSNRLIPFVQAQLSAYLSKDSLAYAGFKSLGWADFGHAYSVISADLVENPDQLDLLYRRACASVGMHAYDRASADLVRALEIDSSFQDGHDLLSDISHLQGITVLGDLTNETQAADSLFLERGKHYLSLGKIQRAEVDFRTSNRLDTRRMLPYYYLALIEYHYRADYKTASTYLNRALQIDPQYRDAYLLRADILEAMGNLEGAKQDRKQVRDWEKSGD